MTMEDKDVKDILERMQRFSWVDYVVFVFMLAISAVVGVYWGFFKKQSTQQDYLLGGRNMKVFPVSMSLVASFVSGITLLGAPTEMYMYGTQYMGIFGGIFFMSFIMTEVYLPVFHDLKLTSNYEYLSMRFDKRVRLFGSLLFTITLVGWLPIVIYVPALAFNQVTGIDIHIITPVICLVCVFYTSAGGLQAVVWTDVIQIMVMFGAMLLVAVKGTLDVGGVGVVLQRNWDGGRIEAPNFDLNPLTRHTVWGLVIGGLVYWLQANAVNQTLVQRYLSLPTLRSAKKAVYIFCVGISLLIAFCFYCGLLIYARYHDCDPLQTQLAKAKDQLLPLLVMDVLGDYPGLSGVFVAGIFSAALSSLSTSLNSMSAVVLEDFYKPFFHQPLSDKQANFVMKAVVILMGMLSLALVFIVEKMGTILQLTMTLEAITMGPQLGVFTLGILMPWVNGKSALLGGASSLCVMSWWCLNAQLAVADGRIAFAHKPMSVRGCTYNYTLAHHKLTPQPSSASAYADHAWSEDSVNSGESDVLSLYRVSYIWYTLAGAAWAIVVGAVAGAVWGRLPPRSLDRALLAPCVRRYAAPPPRPPATPDFILAYDQDLEHQKEKNTNTNISMKTFGKGAGDLRQGS